MDLRDKLKFWIMLSNYVDMIVRGTSPLSLPDAIANSLSYVKAFGGTEQRNLPDSYIERQFIYMMDGSYLTTDIVPTYDCKIEMDFATTSFPGSGSSFIGARSGGPGDGLSLGRSSTNYVQFDGFDGNRYTSSTERFATNTRYKYVWNNQVATLYQGTTTVDTNTFTGTGTTTHALAINGLNNSGSVVGNVAGIYLYSFKMWNAQGELVMDLVPAVQKGTVPVVGFYDTVSKTFMTATAGTFAAGGEAVPTPDAPMDIVSNNGVLTLSPNMTNYGDSSWKDGYFTPTGSIGGANYGQDEMYCETYYPLTAGDSYTLSFCYGGDTLPSNTWACFAFYDSDKNFISRSANSSSIAQNPKVLTPTTIPSGTAYIRISLRTYKSTDNAVYNVQLEKGGSATTYHPYGVYADGTVETLQINTLPAGYTELEYIESSGTQYIDTGIIPTTNTNVKTKFQFTSKFTGANEWNGLFGSKGDNNANTRFYPIGSTNNNADYFRFVYGTSSVETVAFDFNVHTVDFNNSSQQIVLDGVNKGSTSTGFTEVSAQPALTLFAINHAVEGVEWYAKARIYEYSVYENGILIQKLIPCKNDSGVVGMYDTVSETFFTNAGTGDFVAGTPTNTATAEMLLKVGDYQDVQSIIDGVVTRNVGVKVFDGTENWTTSVVSGHRVFTVVKTDIGTSSTVLPAGSLKMICTHFIPHTNSGYTDGDVWAGSAGVNFVKDNFSTTTEWTNWLADQYNAGTPVIVIYPLATPTTESVTGQTLQVQEGNNILEITQASMDGLELEASYKKGA